MQSIVNCLMYCRRATILLPTEKLMNEVPIIDEQSGYDLDYQNTGIILFKFLFSIKVSYTSKRFSMV